MQLLLIEPCFSEQRVLVTEDKDFGELIFLLRLPHPCIVRFDGLSAVEGASAIQSLNERRGNEMQQGAIIVITKNSVRVRFGKSTEQRYDVKRG